MPRSHSTIFQHKKPPLLQLKPQAELGLKASGGWNQFELHKMSAYPHVIVQSPTLTISLSRSKRNPFPSLGFSPHPQLAQRNPNSHTWGGSLTLLGCSGE